VYDGTAGTLLAVAPSDDFVMQPTNGGTLFYMKFRDSLRRYDLYRGQMRMRVNASGVQAINILGMDDYVRGVVPGEMPASWPARALRAQAVAARSFATFKLRTTNTWDVRPDKSFQLYGGVNKEHSATDDAVARTAGIIVLRPNGKVAETLYHAIAGGHTEHNEYAFVSSSGEVWVKPVSYLRGKPDVDSKGVPYEIKHRPNLGGFSWKTADFTMSQLSAILAKDSRTDVGPISSIDFNRGVSGRAYQVTLTGSKGTKQVSGGVFRNIYNKHKLAGGNLRSMLFYLEPNN
jgi:stage II sporulation protein D